MLASRLRVVSALGAVGLGLLAVGPATQAARPAFRISPYMSGMAQQWLAAQQDGVSPDVPSTFQPAPAALTNTQVNPKDNAAHPASQNEPYIVSDPRKPQYVIAGANAGLASDGSYTGYYHSEDGGKTWRGGRFKPGADKGKPYGDPTIAIDLHSSIYFANLYFLPDGNDEIAVYKSVDHGHLWSPPLVAVKESSAKFNDREFLTADTNPNSPYKNDIYLTWAQFDNTGGDNIAFVRSTDGGVTWTKPLPISAPGGMNGATPVVGPDGTIYVGWMDFSQGEMFVKSKDGGTTWTQPKQIAAVNQAPSAIPGTSLRLTSMGNLTVSPKTGTLYAVWTDQGKNYLEIKMTRSTDKGKTWSAPITVNDYTKADHWFPWAAVSPKGVVSVIFNDRRNDPKNMKFDAYLAQSTDDGASFQANVRLSTVSSDPQYAFGLRVPFIGDFLGVSVGSDEVVHPIWTDLRNKNDDVYTASGF